MILLVSGRSSLCRKSSNFAQSIYAKKGLALHAEIRFAETS